jgi:hypothetical protein
MRMGWTIATSGLPDPALGVRVMTDAERGAAIAKSMGESALASSVAANVAGVKNEQASGKAAADASHYATLVDSVRRDYEAKGLAVARQQNTAILESVNAQKASQKKIMLYAGVLAVGGLVVYLVTRRRGHK